MQAGYLVSEQSPTGVGALDHYRSVLLKDPSSVAAQKGIQILLEGLLDSAWQAAARDDLERATRFNDYAAAAGASEEMLNDLSLELAFLDKRDRARAGVFDAVSPIRALTVKRQTEPTLPRGVSSGSIELLFTVDEGGSVQDVQVVSVSNEALIDSAISAVRRWRFEPKLERGRPIPVRTGVRFSFQS